VSAPARLHRDVEQELERVYRLAAAHVVDTLSTDDAELARDLGTAMASIFMGTLAGAATVGFTSWSRTLQHMVGALQPVVPGAAWVVEMLGDLGPPTLQYDTAQVTQRLATLTAGRPAFLRVPGVVSTPDIGRALLEQDPHAREALRLLDALDVTLLSVGPCAVVAPLVAGDNYFTQEQFDEACDRGAVGQICLRFLDAQGRPVPTPLDDLVIGVTFAQLRRARNRWMVGGGEGKRAAIRAALLGGWVDRLVVDTATAEHLVGSALP
jgi:DNA-binding transcriptional regulator LsrR (DeoR family)